MNASGEDLPWDSMRTYLDAMTRASFTAHSKSVLEEMHENRDARKRCST